MPEEFDAEWEYRQDSADVLAAFDHRPACEFGVGGLTDPRFHERGVADGFRVCKASSLSYLPDRLAPDRSPPPKPTRPAVVCPGCARPFPPRRAGQVHCSADCRVPRERVSLADRPCPRCRVVYRPTYRGQRHCGHACRAASATADRLAELAADVCRRFDAGEPVPAIAAAVRANKGTVRRVLSANGRTPKPGNHRRSPEPPNRDTPMKLTTPMTAAVLRSLLTNGSVLPCSPVKFVGPDGAEYHITASVMKCDKKLVAADGSEKADSVPYIVFTLAPGR